MNIRSFILFLCSKCKRLLFYLSNILFTFSYIVIHTLKFDVFKIPIHSKFQGMTTFFEFLINITHSVFSDNKEIMSQLYSNNNNDNSMQNSKEIFIHTSLILIAI